MTGRSCRDSWAATLCAALALSMTIGGEALAAPASATVGWTRTAPVGPIPGAATTITRIVTGPPLWGYRILGNLRAPRIDRLVIDLDRPCAPPKSGGAPTIVPAAGPSQHYVLIYAIPSKNRTISIQCDARRGGNASFTMMALLGGRRILARSATGIVDGPK